jgi:hypothetical protein
MPGRQSVKNLRDRCARPRDLLLCLLALLAVGCDLLDLEAEPPREAPGTNDHIQDFDPNAPAPPPVPRPQPELAPELQPEPEPDAGSAPEPDAGSAPEPEGPPAAAEPPRERPACSLLLAGSLGAQDRLVELAFDPGVGKYMAQASADLEGVEHVAVGAGSIYVSAGKRLLKLGTHLEVTASFDLEAAPAALAADDRRVVVSAGGALVVLDPDLAVQGQCPLECGPRKDGHDILLHHDLALVLDNIVQPVCIFRVDLRSSGEPKVLERIQYTQVNPHLERQWIEPARDLWTILNSSSHRNGSFQTIASYPLLQGSKLLKQQTLGVFTRGKPSRSDRLLTATSRPPLLALIQDPKGKQYLARLAVGAKGVALQRLLPLEGRDPRYTAEHLASQGGCAFVIGSNPPELQILTTGPKPRRILRQGLAEHLSLVDAILPLDPEAERCPVLRPPKRR